MIKKYANNAAYIADGKPTTESRVALLEDGNDIKTDGVNVEVDVPGDGDAVFFDTDGVDHFVRYDTIQKSLLPAAWTHVGYAFGLKGRKFKVLDKTDATNNKWLNAWQYSITAISATSIKFWLHMKGDYAAWVGIEVTLTSAEINATSASEITTALEAAGNTGNVGYAKHGYWAFLADANGNPVDSDGTQIIVQCDLCEDYRQYQCSDSSHALVGCTMALSVWRDMPASNALWRRTKASDATGVLNFAKSYAYYAASGSTPTSNVAVNATGIVNKASFDSSQYCAALRAAYGTYAEYIRANRVLWPHPSRGVFGLLKAIPDMSAKYGNVQVAKKDGTLIYLYPALRYGLTVGYGSGKFAAGKWHLADVDDGMEFMNDATLAKIAEAQTRMGTTVLTNSVSRWFARRANAYYAWFFYGNSGALNSNGVNSSYRCSAVSLCEIK